MRRFTFTLAVLSFLAVFLGCPKGPNFLEGSISESHDLAFDRVEVRSLSDQNRYEVGYFLDLEGGGADTVARIVIDAPEGGAKAGKAIDILEAGGVVQRVTAANDNFPELESGNITFATDPVIGEKSSGEFATVFINGKTLNGGFESEVVECTFDAAVPCQ